MPVGAVNEPACGEAKRILFHATQKDRNEGLTPCGLMTQKPSFSAGRTSPSWSALCHCLGLKYSSSLTLSPARGECISLNTPQTFMPLPLLESSLFSPHLDPHAGFLTQNRACVHSEHTQKLPAKFDGGVGSELTAPTHATLETEETNKVILWPHVQCVYWPRRHSGHPP